MSLGFSPLPYAAQGRVRTASFVMGLLKANQGCWPRCKYHVLGECGRAMLLLGCGLVRSCPSRDRELCPLACPVTPGHSPGFSVLSFSSFAEWVWGVGCE